MFGLQILRLLEESAFSFPVVARGKVCMDGLEGRRIVVCTRIALSYLGVLESSALRKQDPFEPFSDGCLNVDSIEYECTSFGAYSSSTST
jgi:hypothetical protein